MHSCCKFLQCNYKRLHQQDQMNKILYLAVSRACIINCCISIDRVSIYYCRRVLSRLSEDDAKGETEGSCHPLTPTKYGDLCRKSTHRFHNRFSQSRRRPLLGPSPG